MSGPFVEIVLRGVRALRRSMAWWSAGVVAFILVNLAFWPSLEGSDALESFEEMDELLAAFGAQNITTPDGYLDGQVFALLVPLLLAAMAITIASGLTAGDESAGRLELLHALPVARSTIWLGRWVATIGIVVVVAAASLLATLVAMPIFSLDEASEGRVIAAMVGSALLALFHGAVAYAVAGLGGSRSMAVGVGVLVLVAGYVAAFVLPIAESLEGAQHWSPWYWAIGEQPVSDGVQPGWMLFAAAWTVGLVALGTVGLDRRDLRTA